MKRKITIISIIALLVFALSACTKDPEPQPKLFEEFDAAIAATVPEGLAGSLTVETEHGDMCAEYTATIGQDGSIKVKYSYDSFNEIGSGAADDVLVKKTGTVTRSADGEYNYTGEKVNNADDMADAAAVALNLDASKLSNYKIEGDTLSMTVSADNAKDVLGIEPGADVTFVMVKRDAKISFISLEYTVESGKVTILCEYK